MKIIEQYLKAIGLHLPIKHRKEILLELKNNLLDEIESKHEGKETEDDVKEIIKNFGNPSKVASRYKERKMVISEGFSDLYFLVLKLMIAGIAIAYITIFIVELITNPEKNIAMTLLRVPLHIFSAGLSGTGFISIMFILVSRFYRDAIVDLEKDWTPEDLKGIEIDSKTESMVESIASITFLFITMLFLLIAPELFSKAESLFELSSFKLGHRLNIDVFRWYAIAMAIFCGAEIFLQALVIKFGEKTKGIVKSRGLLTVFQMVLMGIMIADRNLYIGSGFIGFKLIWLIILLVSAVETISWLIKTIINKLENK